MQVLLPYPNLRLSSHVLHRDDLSRQQSHALEILMRLAGRGRSSGRRFFAPVMLWEGHEPALLRYAEGVWRERCSRGIEVTDPSPASPAAEDAYGLPAGWRSDPARVPDWVGLEKLHASHRALLLARRPAWYAQFAWIEPAVRSAWWPAQMPSAGDRVLGPDGRIWWVERRTESGLSVFLGRERREVSSADVRTRVWQRVIEGEL
jgi:hypothetical protein